ncbi:MAG: hypothetical protein AVDCRST_MAG04-2798, partial [uncultured Acetobacteraceae bacterium]
VRTQHCHSSASHPPAPRDQGGAPRPAGRPPDLGVARSLLGRRFRPGFLLGRRRVGHCLRDPM